MNEIESWKNGKWVPNSKLGVSTWDAHYFFGYAVFDAFRTYAHRLHNVKYHIDRFYRGASLTGIDIPLTKKELLSKVKETMKRNKSFFDEDEYRFMVFVTPGKFRIYDDMGDTTSNLTIQLTTTSRYAKFIYPNLEKGWTSLITHQKQIPSRFFDVRIKSCSRLHYGLAELECKKLKEPTNPILLDEHGNICESSGSNIAFVKENTLHIPKGTDMLYGATIQNLEEAANLRNIPVEHGVYKPYDIVDCDCILYTSTYSGITPSYKLIYNSNEYNFENTGIYDEILKGFNEITGIDVKKQWKDWYEKTI